MNYLNAIVAWFKPAPAGTAKPDLLTGLGLIWKPAAPATSSTPAPNASTPVEKTPAATPPPATTETGDNLGALLDAIASIASKP
jgi:hypothetical protein